jgi:aminopeptidase N
MQHLLLGPARFRAGMDLYFERHDGQAVTCDDFVQAMQDASGVDLAQFRNWYSTPGTPIVSARGTYDPAARTYVLEVSQRMPAVNGGREPSPLHVPLAVGLVAPDGHDMPLRLAGEAAASGTTRVLELTRAVQRFRFVDVNERPVPSLLRGFSAPVRLEYAYSDEELALLAAHDSDAVNRWDAAQRSFVNAVIALADVHANGTGLAPAPLLSRIVRALLTDRTSDPALLAQALALPDPAYVASLMPAIEPDGIEAAFAHVARTLARDLRDAFEDTYRAHRQSRGPYASTPAQSGARSLANLCLRYLGTLDDERAHALALRQYETADNLTDAIGALAALRDSALPVRDELYARFEARWRDEPLVLDKWFALQAKSLRPDTLANVRGLVTHSRFNARNPNRVRSLVGAFALGNFARFNARDGEGYAFVAEQVRVLDPMNPQLASTLAGAFNLWRRHREPRRTAMQRCLQRIARTKNLSPDVSEVVTRALSG